MKVVPLGANVVVRRMESEETTAGGIVLPGSAQEKPKQGRVLSVGDGHVLKDGTKTPLDVKEGEEKDKGEEKKGKKEKGKEERRRKEGKIKKGKKEKYKKCQYK